MEDPKPSFSFEAGLHDDLFEIVEVLRKSQVVEESEATGLAVGLKLFAETVMRHRKNPNFAVFEAPLRQFVGLLKQARGR